MEGVRHRDEFPVLIPSWHTGGTVGVEGGSDRGGKVPTKPILRCGWLRVQNRNRAPAAGVRVGTALDWCDCPRTPVKPPPVRRHAEHSVHATKCKCGTWSPPL